MTHPYPPIRKLGLRGFTQAHGYLDDVFDILDAHQHPCIVMGRSVLLWMGSGVLPRLIRNSQIAAIAEDIPRTGNWKEAPLVHTYGEDYLQPPPRVFERTDGTFSIKVWSEEAVRLLVNPPADGRVGNGHFLIEAPCCCEVLSPVLLESDMHSGPEISENKPSLLTTPDVCFLPRNHICSQSASREPQSKVYIPTISRYLYALLAQSRCRGRELLNTVSVFGDAKPKKEDIAVTGKRVKEQDGAAFGSVQEDIQTQVQSQGGKRR
ncbi:hypothetical protein M378DRAFT_14479 [Amanita muscaria Koide BX008]|uniref:Uncharacterized protein n=1 Tax=Amanita muscaria (strain Koide BX008) TaxID=946122 RepID=A0A0C2WUA1_AMAMK|nr:hypothetical protein M378DRAFT_14479 [Amanita muscaria Koide BX008]